MFDTPLIKGAVASLVPIVGLTLLFVLGLPIFMVQYNRRGRPRTERIMRAGGSILLGQWFMEYGYWFLGVPARAFTRMGISPDMVTLFGLGIISLGSAAVGFGYFGLGGWLMIFGAMLDAIDGMVARESGRSSDAGEFLDAVVDRYAEIASYIGLCYYYNDRPWCMAAVLGALLGSLMVSYGRAKAESLGVHDAPSGLMRRHERAVYLGMGISLAPVVSHFVEPQNPHPVHHLTVIACALVGLLANISAIQMTSYVKRKLRHQSAGHRMTEPEAETHASPGHGSEPESDPA
jgi:CDP-diacylglycerol--glycerol-3-phosphate 3-phosphatidyltransferase